MNWDKQQDRSLSWRADYVGHKLFWPSASKGTYNMGRNAAKRERRAAKRKNQRSDHK